MNRKQPGALFQRLRTLVPEASASSASDRELLQRFAGLRDEAAFALLVRRHGPMVLRLCQRILHNGHDAEDACQATFLVLAAKAHASGWQTSVASWLHRVAYHVALRARAATRRRAVHERAVTVRLTPDPLETITGRELQSVLDEELARLPERYRAPLVLCYLEGATRDEAGRRLGCPLGTLKSRLEQGRRLLQARLGKRGLAFASVLSANALLENPLHAAPPPGMWERVVRGALTLPEKQAASAGASSGPALELAHEALHTMALAKWRVALTVLVAVALLVGSAGAVAYQALVGEPPEETPRQPAAVAIIPQAGTLAGTRTDRYGDPLPEGAVGRLGSMRLRHVEATSVAFAPDGKSVASVRRNGGPIRLWDPATGRELRRFGDELGAKGGLVFAPDGKTLASVNCYRAVICIWDVANGHEVRAIDILPRIGVGAYLAWSPDGKTLATTDSEHAIRLFDSLTGKELPRLSGPTGDVLAICYSPDGTVFAAASTDRAVFLWESATGKLLHRLAGHANQVASLAFSADGKTLATGSNDQTVRLWDVASGKEGRRFTFEDHFGEVLGVVFVPHRPELIAGNRWSVRVWNLTTGLEVRRFTGLADFSESPLACSPDGKLLAKNGQNVQVELYELASGKRIAQSEGHQRPIVKVAPDPAGKLFASSSWDGTVRLWDLAASKELQQFPLSMGGPLVFTPDGATLIVGGDDGFVRYWDVAAWKELRRFAAHEARPQEGGGVACVALSADGKRLATGGRDHTIGLWDTATGKLVRRLEGHREGVSDVVFAPDGRTLASASMDRTVRLWDTQSGAEIRQLKGPRERMASVAFAPDGQTVAGSGFDNMIFLWETATGREVGKFEGHEGWVETVRFSPDGKTLASCSNDETVRVWDVGTGKERRRFRGHQNFVWTLAFLPDGRTLASAGLDGTILLWDAR